jgi:hypothetical protein
LFSIICGYPPVGNWYDSGNAAQLDVDSPSGPLWLQSFDYWSGNIAPDQTTSSHVTLLMNGPKNITAHWKWDYQIHLAVIGSAIGIASAFGLIPRIQRLIRHRKQPKLS